MSAPYAVGKIAWGICDRCGRRRYLSELTKQVVNQVVTELKVCDGCLDEDHPQYQLGKFPVYDPQALQDPRPDSRDDVTITPQLVGFTSIGVPVFSTIVTPSNGGLASGGTAPTIRRG